MKRLFITTLLLLPLHINANDTTEKPDLSHEPIQPLQPTKNLNHDKIALGKKLFHEPRLSRDSKMSCATCHNLKFNGASHCARSTGRDNIELPVNTPTVFNSTFNHRQFWDGRASNLQEQVNFVVNGHREFATSWAQIVKKLKQDTSYINDFRKIYTNGISAGNIRDAIVTFERSLVTLNSRFDRYLLGDIKAITKKEKAGYKLFKSYGCVACHQGRNVGGNLFMKLGVFANYIAERGNPTTADQGRFNVTGDKRDHNVFRVPSLRLAAYTAPYFHDGSVNTLQEAIKIMAKHQLGRNISDHDISLIAAFIKTLPGEYAGQPLGALPDKVMNPEEAEQSKQ